MTLKRVVEAVVEAVVETVMRALMELVMEVVMLGQQGGWCGVKGYRGGAMVTNKLMVV